MLSPMLQRRVVRFVLSSNAAWGGHLPDIASPPLSSSETRCANGHSAGEKASSTAVHPVCTALSSRGETFASLGPDKRIRCCSANRRTIIPSPTSMSPRNTTSLHVRRAPNCSSGSKTLVVIFGFYRAPEKAIQKYCSVYHKYNMDVLYVQSIVKHFVWPKNSMALSEDVLSFLLEECSDYSFYLIHAFSMGAFNFTMCFDNMYSNPDRFGLIQRKICGIVYDSLTIGNLNNMIQGMTLAITTNTLVKVMASMVISAYFALTKKNTVDIFDQLVALFKRKPLEVPTIFFGNRDDPMAIYEVVEELLEDWRTKFSFPITEVCWDKSKHAGHLMVHPQEYLHHIENFLKSIPQIAADVKEISPAPKKPLVSKL